MDTVVVVVVDATVVEVPPPRVVVDDVDEVGMDTVTAVLANAFSPMLSVTIN